MTLAPKRRWLRWSLLTLFALLIICACSFGWCFRQWQIVQERKAVLAEIDRSTDPLKPQVRDLESLEALHDLDPEKFGVPPNAEYARVSRFRRWLGDSSYIGIETPATVGPEWIERAEHAFPEAWLVIPGEPRQGRDSLYKPKADRVPNEGTVFKTGIIAK